MAKIKWNGSEGVGKMGFSPLPKDTYVLRINESEYKENSKKTGMNLSLQMEVQEGEYKGRIIYRNLCMEHTSPATVKRANEEYLAICQACGFPTGTDDSDDLHGIDFEAAVTVKKGSGDNADENRIQSYSSLEGAAKPSADTKPKKSSKPVFDEDEEEEEEKPKKKKKPVFEDEDEEDDE